jgi:hypothetical protein
MLFSRTFLVVKSNSTYQNLGSLLVVLPLVFVYRGITGLFVQPRGFPSAKIIECFSDLQNECATLAPVVNNFVIKNID